MSNISKVLKGMPAYLEKVASINLGETPIDYLMINIPPVCNYQCKKCFTSANSKKVKNSLTFDEIKEIILFGKKNGVKVICILGEGEPLFYPKFKDIIKFIDKNKMISLIATNGRLLTKQMVNFLDTHNATVVVSLDTLDEKEYNEFCGGNAELNAVIENLKYARKKFKKSIKQIDKNKIYKLGIHMTVTAKNYKNVAKIEEFCGDDIYFDCQTVADVGDAEKNPSYVGDQNTYEKYKVRSEKLYPPMVLTKTKDGKYCGLFYYGLSIGYEGEVMFDTHAVESKHIGNIRDYPINKLFEKVKKLRKIYKEKYSTTYCPVRDKNYRKFLKFIQKNK